MENLVINRGNPRRVEIAVLGANGVQVELSRCTDVELVLWINGRSKRAQSVQVANDILIAELSASELDYLGEYSAQVKYTDNGIRSASERVYLFRVANEFYRTASNLSDNGNIAITVTTPQALNKGYSAYELAVQGGFVGTESEWVASLSKDSIEAAQVAIAATIAAEEATNESIEQTRLSAEATQHSIEATEASLNQTNLTAQAVAEANSARDKANTAAVNAEAKATLAQNNANLANAAATTANSSAVAADAKATLAQSAADNANAKATLAQNATTAANTAATQANTARDAANTAATNATNAATAANSVAGRVTTLEGKTTTLEQDVAFNAKKISDIAQTTVIIYNNLFNKATSISGYYISTSTGNNTASANSYISDKIPVSPNTNYTISGRQSYGAVTKGIRCYDSGGVKSKPLLTDGSVSAIYGIEAINGSFRTPSNCTHIDITIAYDSATFLNTAMLNVGLTALPYEPFGQSSTTTIKESAITPYFDSYDSEIKQYIGDIIKSPLNGKRMLVLGDSSTAKSSSGWAEYVKERYDMTIFNIAGGGNTWLTRYNATSGATERCIRNQLNIENKTFNPDIIVIQAGGNDIGLPSQWGTITNGIGQYNNVDETTFVGAIRRITEYLRDTYPNAVIVYGTFFQRKNMGVNSECEQLHDLQTRAFELAQPDYVIDGYSLSGITAWGETADPAYTDAGDGIATRDFPLYNWVEPDGTIATVANKTADAVKKYGRWTYDGIHQTALGAIHIGQLYAYHIEQAYKMRL